MEWLVSQPLPCLNKHVEQPKGPFLCLFAIPSEFGPFSFPVVPKNVKLHNKNYYDEFNYRY